MKVLQNIAVGISLLLCSYVIQIPLFIFGIGIKPYHWWSVEVTHDLVPRLYQILGLWIQSNDVSVGFNHYHSIIIEINILSIFSAILFAGFYYLATLYIKRFQEDWKIELPTIAIGIIGLLSFFLRGMGDELRWVFFWILILSSIVNGIMWGYLKEKAKYTKYATYISASIVILAIVLEITDLTNIF